MNDTSNIRVFESGAKRDSDKHKLDYDGALSPEVLRAFAIFMDFNRQMADGSSRSVADWKQGVPLDVYMKSAMRHFMSWWLAHHGNQTSEDRVWALLALLFNLQGYLHEWMKAHPSALALSLSAAIATRDLEKKK